MQKHHSQPASPTPALPVLPSGPCPRGHGLTPQKDPTYGAPLVCGAEGDQSQAGERTQAPLVAVWCGRGVQRSAGDPVARQGQLFSHCDAPRAGPGQSTCPRSVPTGFRGERLNIEMDQGQTAYKDRTLTRSPPRKPVPHLQEPAQEAAAPVGPAGNQTSISRGSPGSNRQVPEFCPRFQLRTHQGKSNVLPKQSQGTPCFLWAAQPP